MLCHYLLPRHLGPDCAFKRYEPTRILPDWTRARLQHRDTSGVWPDVVPGPALSGRILSLSDPPNTVRPKPSSHMRRSINRKNDNRSKTSFMSGLVRIQESGITRSFYANPSNSGPGSTNRVSRAGAFTLRHDRLMAYGISAPLVLGLRQAARTAH